jgi:hypothetical protein
LAVRINSIRISGVLLYSVNHILGTYGEGKVIGLRFVLPLPRNLEEMKKVFVAATSTADGDDREVKTARMTCAV